MPYPFPPDVSQRIHTHLERGHFQTEDDVLRAAITALERESDDLAAIQAGIDDVEAGRFRPFTEIDAEFRQKHNVADKA